MNVVWTISVWLIVFVEICTTFQFHSEVSGVFPSARSIKMLLNSANHLWDLQACMMAYADECLVTS